MKELKGEKCMKFKKLVAVMCITAISMTSLAACGSEPAAPAEGDAASTEKVTLQIGFENSITEPLGQALEHWATLLDEQSGGTMEIVLYPDSQLGAKTDLIDSMLLGENVATLADGAFYADYGVPDFGIVFGPFLFDNWEQCWTLIESNWYKEQEAQLEGKGLKLLASNWAYGARHTLTVKPVNTVEDLAGMKIRVPSNQIQSLGFDVLGAASTGMSLGDVYQALQTKTIDGAENPLATLYGRKLHEVAQNLILDSHVLNFTTWVCSNDWFNSLTEEQQNLLLETGKEAGFYNNEIQAASEAEYLQMMIDEGVTVVEPSPEVIDGFKEKAQAFYAMGDKFGWSEGLYDTVRAAMGAN